MAKRSVRVDSTSQREYVFVNDSTSTTGAGKTGIAFNASGLKAYYVRPGGSATAITLATQTVTGAYSSGGWVEVDATNMPGVYRFDIPNAVFATGVEKAIVMVFGATGMAPVVMEYDLTAYDPYDTVRLGLTALPNVASGSAGAIITSGTGTAQLSVSSGLVTLAAVTHTGATIPTVSTVTNGVTVSTNNDKTGYSLTQAFPTNFSSLAITAGGSVTAGTVNDKTGYSLTQAFPSNFASLGINASGHVSRVTLVDTTTTNTDMRGTDSAALASAWTATRAGYLDSVLIAANANQRTVSVTGSQRVAADVHETQPGAIHATTFDAGAIDAAALAADAATEIATATLTGQMTESYRAAGVAPTLAQVMFELIAHMGDSAISGTTKTLRRLDGTTAKTFTLNSSTAPTAIEETT